MKDINHCGDQKHDRLVAAIDEGTSSTRFIVFSTATEEVVAYHQLPIKQYHPNTGWVEQDPIEILDAVKETIEVTVKDLNSKHINVSDIVAVGISNQRETTVLWDKNTGKPLSNAIVWMDNRTSETVEKLLNDKPDKGKNQLVELCGLPINPYFSALKYRWLIDNVPEVKKAVNENRCMFGTIDTWLIWNLTGGVDGGLHLTDVTNASRTMLMNLSTLQWDEELLKFFDISSKTLPKICSSSEIYGKFSCTALKNIHISGCLGDQQAAVVGQKCLETGQIKCTYGTGCFLLCNTGLEKIHSKNGLLTTVAYQLGKDKKPVYALEGSISAAGATFSWLRDKLRIIDQVTHVESLAEEVSNTNDVYFVPAFQGLYAPYWEPNARGIIIGLTMDTDRRHIIRAALEAVCFQTKALLEAIKNDTGIDLKELKVDGGMIGNKLFLNLLADICDLAVVKQEMQESTAFGAAIAAGLAEGINAWDLSKSSKLYDRYEPQMIATERHKRTMKWKTAVERCLGWNMN